MTMDWLKAMDWSYNDGLVKVISRCFAWKL